jgi:hypothetical protein
MRFLRGLLVGGVLTAVASAASAVPVVYTFTSGSVTLTATVSGTGVAGPVTIPLSGTSVTLDQGALYLNSISFAVGSSPSIPVSYAGFTSIHIDFATLTGTGGTLIPLIPSVYDYSIGPVNVAGQFDAVHTNPINNINNAPFGFINPSASGTIFVGLGQIDLDGITLGQIDADGAGPIPPLILKGDFTFTGVPEPGTALLLGMGLAGFAGLRRRSPRA